VTAQTTMKRMEMNHVTLAVIQKGHVSNSRAQHFLCSGD